MQKVSTCETNLASFSHLSEKHMTGPRPDRDGRNLVRDDGCAGDAASYGPKSTLVLDEPVE